MTRCLVVVALIVMPFVTVIGEQPSQTVPAKTATARIAGRVVAADTGRPLRGAVLRLVSVDVMRVAKTATTDAEGRYAFADLRAGRYQLEASADRYLTLRYGQRRPVEAGRPIDLLDGTRVEQADFALPRAGAIEGVLLDEFGDPAPNIRVQIARLEFIAGRRRLLPVGNANATRPTDDRGHFRIAGVAPGDYYVTALCGAFVEQNDTGGFAPTYYPGTTDAATARPVRVGFGVATVPVTFALVPARMARVSGTVMTAGGQPSGATVLLMHSDQAGTVDSLMARGLAKDGPFTFRNVPPGTYVIQGFGSSPSGALGQAPFGWVPLVVNERDITDVSVVVSPGAWARGRIVLEGDAAPTLTPSDVRITASPIEFDSSPRGGGPPQSATHDDWRFEVGNMSGLRRLRVDVSAPAWSLKRISLGGHDVTDVPIDFRKGDDIDGVEIVLTTRNGSVTGAVVDRNGQPTSDYTVVIYAADRARWPFPSRFVQLARPNQEGQFTARGLPPEDYLAVALPSVRGTEWMDPEFLEKMKPVATPLKLSEGETKKVSLTLTNEPPQE